MKQKYSSREEFELSIAKSQYELLFYETRKEMVELIELNIKQNEGRISRAEAIKELEKLVAKFEDRENEIEKIRRVLFPNAYGTDGKEKS